MPYMLGKKIPKTLKNRTLVKTAIISGLNISLTLLVLNLISLNLDILEQSFTLAITLYLLISIILFNLHLKKIYLAIRSKNPNVNKILAGILLILFSFILLIFTKNQMLWIASIPILISGLDLTLRSLDIKRKELYLLSVTSFAYTIFFILLQTIPALWQIIQQFSLMFSGAIGSIINKPLSLGPSTSGLWIVITFITLSIVSLFLYHKKRSQAIKLVFNILGLLIFWTIYVIVLTIVEFESKNDVVNLHIIFFLFCLIPTFIYLLNFEFKESKIDILNFKAKKIIKNGAIWAL